MNYTIFTHMPVNGSDPIKGTGIDKRAFRLYVPCMPDRKMFENVCVSHDFVVVMYKKLVPGSWVSELRVLDDENQRKSHPIDPKWLKKILAGTEYEGCLVDVVEGRSFIKETTVKDWMATWEDAIKYSLSNQLLSGLGDVLSVAWTFRDNPGLVDNSSATALTTMVNDVARFGREMYESGEKHTVIGNKKHLEDVLSKSKDRLRELEDERREALETFEKNTAILREYGIEYNLMG